MFIKSITIDGFKSYGQRTEVTGFDEQFNAITGLNGSGKSNILDSICFVLGITNLSHVCICVSQCIAINLPIFYTTKITNFDRIHRQRLGIHM